MLDPSVRCYIAIPTSVCNKETKMQNTWTCGSTPSFLLYRKIVRRHWKSTGRQTINKEALPQWKLGMWRNKQKTSYNRPGGHKLQYSQVSLQSTPESSLRNQPPKICVFLLLCWIFNPQNCGHLVQNVVTGAKSVPQCSLQPWAPPGK